MDKHTPVRMAFVDDYIDAKKAYEQARSALLTQFRPDLPLWSNKINGLAFQ
jgi:hypothetical protein